MFSSKALQIWQYFRDTNDWVLKWEATQETLNPPALYAHASEPHPKGLGGRSREDVDAVQMCFLFLKTVYCIFHDFSWIDLLQSGVISSSRNNLTHIIYIHLLPFLFIFVGFLGVASHPHITSHPVTSFNIAY